MNTSELAVPAPVVKPSCVAVPRQIETDTCGRCGGTGRMPFSVYGGLCFKCHGKGKLLTKRGQAANDFLVALRSKPASELKVGDVVRAEHFRITSLVYSFDKITVLEPHTEANANGWSVGPNGEKIIAPGLKLETYNERHGTSSRVVSPTDMIRVAQTAEQKLATLTAALDYQDTLTKQGKPRKAGQKA